MQHLSLLMMKEETHFLKQQSKKIYHARSFPSAETSKAQIVSRTIGFETILFHVVVFHFTMLPPLPISYKKHKL